VLRLQRGWIAFRLRLRVSFFFFLFPSRFLIPHAEPDPRHPPPFFFFHDSSSRTQDPTLDSRPALWSGDSRLAPGSRGSGLPPGTPPSRRDSRVRTRARDSRVRTRARDSRVPRVLPTRPGKRGRVEEQSNTRQDKTKERNKRGPRKIIILIINNSF